MPHQKTEVAVKPLLDAVYQLRYVLRHRHGISDAGYCCISEWLEVYRRAVADTADLLYSAGYQDGLRDGAEDALRRYADYSADMRAQEG